MASPNFFNFGEQPFYDGKFDANSNRTDPDSVPVDNQSVHHEIEVDDVRECARGKRPRTARVWQHFTEELRPNPKTGEMEMRAVCNYCKKTYANKKGGGTGHINRHWPGCLATHQGGGVDSCQ